MSFVDAQRIAAFFGSCIRAFVNATANKNREWIKANCPKAPSMQQLELCVRILKRKMRPSPAVIRMKVAAAQRLALILGISFGAVLDAAGTKDLNWFKQRAELRAVSTKRLGEK